MNVFQEQKFEEKANSKGSRPKKTPNSNITIQDRNQLGSTSSFFVNNNFMSYGKTTTSLQFSENYVSPKISNSTSN